MSDKNTIYDVIIIGAGASGLFCGATCGTTYGAAQGDIHCTGTTRGLILEKTGRAGTKLLMSGNGQCNITHAGSIKDFLTCYGDKGKSIRSCLYKHNNLDLMDFLAKGGVPVYSRDDGKVFPVSMDAHDVLELLLRKSSKNGFEIKYDSPVTGIKPTCDGLWRITVAADTDNSNRDDSGSISYIARKVIIATGGCSYPSSGSDGSIFNVLKRDLGIKVTKIKPALSSIQVEDYPYGELAGIAFEGVQASIVSQNPDNSKSGKPASSIGEGLLFTHNDLSGPAVLNISKYAEPGDELKINYLYPLNYEQVLERLKTATHGSKSSMVNIVATEFDLPKRFAQLIVEQAGTSLKNLAQLLTGQVFKISSISGFNRAMATSGGIALDQINTTTMEFKEHPGLYAIGEALDVDGITGGYNLQFAYSSARAATNTN